MPANLLLCLTQQKITAPYQFRLTNIRVYSFEEALYHAYHYWKESLDDIISKEFIDWVSDGLGLSYIAAKIANIAPEESLSVRLVEFLSVTDYFNEDELGDLYRQLKEWEDRLEWERLKDRADHFNNAGQPVKAYPLYRRALNFGDNAQLNNNAGVCLMKMNRNRDAVIYFEKAREADPDNINILKNLTEALIYDRRFDEAQALLDEIENRPDAGNIFYLYGELSYESGNIFKAADYYEKAVADETDAPTNYNFRCRLAEIYVKLRFFDKALEVMNNVSVKDRGFLMKQADIYAACNNIPSAIKCIEKALLSNKNSAVLWVKLAQFHRQNYDNGRAEMSVRMALDIEPENAEAMLENARIKKLAGKTREYQNILKSILQNFKKSYRDFNKEIII